MAFEFSKMIRKFSWLAKPAEVSPLYNVIKQELRASVDVPMSLHRFMELGLSHPQHGYYSTKDKIFSKGGDFTTSPEIS
jgi:NADH dehydrogenase [ubiquinone] 1 alpha subcomplex assembly factor 7